jgi:hypothetical protein
MLADELLAAITPQLKPNTAPFKKTTILMTPQVAKTIWEQVF